MLAFTFSTQWIGLIWPIFLIFGVPLAAVSGRRAYTKLVLEGKITPEECAKRRNHLLLPAFLFPAYGIFLMIRVFLT